MVYVISKIYEKFQSYGNIVLLKSKDARFFQKLDLTCFSLTLLSDQFNSSLEIPYNRLRIS